MLALSVVIPVFNEQANLEPLHARLRDVLPQLPQPCEFIFVNDGSTDGTQDNLLRLGQMDPHVGWVQLRRNSGKATAYMAGFNAARGQIIVTMDGDLQDDPQDILSLLAALEGYDMVAGWKYRGKGAFDRALPSRIFNMVVSRVSRLKLHDFNCPLKAYRREVVQELVLYGELHRFIPLLAHRRGFKITETKVENYPRLHGKSKYGFARFLRGYLDLITILFLTRYTESPLYVFGFLGSMLFGIGFVLDLAITVHGLFTTGRVGNFAALVLGLFMMMIGLQLFATGLVADLITSRSSLPNYPIAGSQTSRVDQDSSGESR